MKVINDDFLDECCTFILVFSLDKCVESFINILKFLCHEHNFLAHDPQLLAHGSFNKVARAQCSRVRFLLACRCCVMFLLSLFVISLMLEEIMMVVRPFCDDTCCQNS